MKTIAILVKEKFANSVLECISGTYKFNYLFTEPELMGTEKLVLFVVSGDEDNIDFLEKWVNGAFSTASARVLKFHLDKNNKLSDVFLTDEDYEDDDPDNDWWN